MTKTELYNVFENVSVIDKTSHIHRLMSISIFF